jgi:VacB/RNase II family 3'-5' exoribonuclease
MANAPASGRDVLKRIAHDAMLQRGLQPDFPSAALAEADQFSHAAVAADTTIRDLRGLPWASIDNDDSRDLDQLSVAQPMADGTVRILVAIADVDALVRQRSAIDAHAAANTTSVYTAAQIFPMLPERLSTDLTSLGEGQERLGIVIDMTVGSDGVVQGSDIYRATVLNHAKLAYNDVAAWLEGTAPAPAKIAAVPGLDEQLRIQDRTAQALKHLRHAQGALRLETLEVRAVFANGGVADLRPDEKNRAKELIEDFMIAANGVTARFLEARRFPSLRRVLHVPKRWDRIVALAADAGERLPSAPDAAALDQFLTRRRAADPANFSDLSLAVVKLLGAGEYALRLPGQSAAGHFGLAVRDYTHSTAPNRRFPDLIAQRLLKAALAGSPPSYANDELAQIGCRAAAGRADRAALRCHRDGRLRQGHLGADFQADGGRPGRPRLPGPRRRRAGPRRTGAHRRGARLHRLRCHEVLIPTRPGTFQAQFDGLRPGSL